MSYGKLGRSASFKRGLERVDQGRQRHVIALMCAEKEPLACHRTLLVARELMRRSIPVSHILADGSLETHSAALSRLLALTGLAEPELFRSLEERIDEAYAQQAQKVAYAAAAEDEGRGPEGP